MRVAAYSLEPALGTGTRIHLVGARASFSEEIREALAQPEQEPAEEVEAPGPAEEAIEEAERVTGWVERASSLLNSVLAGNLLERAVVEAEARAGLALVEWLDRRGRLRDVLRVSRVLVSLLLLVMRWRDLVGTVRTALRSARELGDLAGEAWAQHELGTVALAGGDVEQAAARLERARALRGQLGDEPGLAVTEANLSVVHAVAASSRGSGHRNVWRLVVAAAAVIVIGVVVAVALLLTQDDGPPTPTSGTVNLSVALAGDGAGTVTSRPAGISCGDTCSAGFGARSDVVLEADAAAGSRFTGWSGAGCSGTEDCSVTMDQAQSVTAAFGDEPTPDVTLAVALAGDGAGTVTSQPAGISCGDSCSAEFGARSDVVLEAAAAAGSRFTGWSGAGCSGTDGCSVTMDRAQSVTATFAVEQPEVTLTTATDGSGRGSIDPDCSGGCPHRVGDAVTLTATPTPPGTDTTGSGPEVTSSFVRWTGCTPEAEPICHVTLTTSLTITATFDAAVE